MGELERLQGPGWIAGSRTDINVKCNLAGEKVLLIDNVKASYKEGKKEATEARQMFPFHSSGDAIVCNPGT